VMSYGVLVDTTKCIGCRSCQVSCKQWNGLSAEETHIEGRATGYQNPMSLSAHTFTMVTNREVADPKALGGFKRVFAKRQCMHCIEPACAAACPVTALHKTPQGPVTYDSTKCMGCRYCVWACPFGVPTTEWQSLTPTIRKCTFCFNRIAEKTDLAELNGQPVTPDAKERYVAGSAMPACVKACTTGALRFGERGDLLKSAWERIRSMPDRYVQHVYGEHEVGGTSYLYLASVPFANAGFRADLGAHSYATYSKAALGLVPPAVMGLGGVLAAVYLLQQRKEKLAAATAKKEEE
jgi:formate dehydrogenase iron-sulfur subunit